MRSKIWTDKTTGIRYYTIEEEGLVIELNDSNRDIHVVKNGISVFSRQTNADGEKEYIYFDSVIEEGENRTKVIYSDITVYISPVENKPDRVEVFLYGEHLLSWAK
jgi:hypothetical protein